MSLFCNFKPWSAGKLHCERSFLLNSTRKLTVYHTVVSVLNTKEKNFSISLNSVVIYQTPVKFKWPSHGFKLPFSVPCTDFPSSPLYDEVKVAFTSLPGGLTKELLIYGSPYCIQIGFSPATTWPEVKAKRGPRGLDTLLLWAAPRHLWVSKHFLWQWLMAN